MTALVPVSDAGIRSKSRNGFGARSAHPSHICTETGRTPAASALGLGSPLPHPHPLQDRASNKTRRPRCLPLRKPALAHQQAATSTPLSAVRGPNATARRSARQLDRSVGRGTRCTPCCNKLRGVATVLHCVALRTGLITKSGRPPSAPAVLPPVPSSVNRGKS